MKFLHLMFSRRSWVGLPGLVLIALLQRSPVLRVLLGGGEAGIRAVSLAILKSGFVAAGMGAVHSLAGATVVTTSRPSPLNLTAGSAMQPVAFGVAGGASSVPGSWQVLGEIPPGLRFGVLTEPGFFNDDFPLLEGTPTSAGTFNMQLQAWHGPNRTDAFTEVLTYTVQVAGSASPPAFTTPPVAKLVRPGGSVTFTAVASSATSYQWRKDGVNLPGETTTSLTVSGITAASAGNYSVVATGPGGSTTSTPVALSVVATSPRSVTAREGSVVALTAGVANPAGATYRWERNGQTVPGATSDTLVLTGVTAADDGVYALVATNSGGTALSDGAQVTVTSAAESRIVNMSVRTNLASGQLLILGFVTVGTKSMLVRSVGPGLATAFPNFFTSADVFPDPRTNLISSVQLEQNEDWGAPVTLDTFDRLGAFRLVQGSKDSAILRSVDGPHTAHVNGSGSGVLLVELYDADGTNPGGRLVNVSARNHVGTGANILIAGFVIQGPTAKTVLIRAKGPNLAQFGVPNVLADPRLSVFTPTELVAENNEWNSLIEPFFSQVGSGLQAGSKDAALLVTLPPGAYTAHVSGVGDTVGEALVEVFEIQ